ncbi:MAG: hypothetical protein M1835_003541, partial [Candelina submexicana]
YLLSVSSTTIAIMRATAAVSAGWIADGAREVSTTAKQFQSVKCKFPRIIKNNAYRPSNLGNTDKIVLVLVEARIADVVGLVAREGFAREAGSVKYVTRFVVEGIGALSELVIRVGISSEDAKDASGVAKLVGMEIKDAARLVVGEAITREGIGNSTDVAMSEPNWEQHPPKAPLGSQVAPSKSLPQRPSILGPEELSEVLDVGKELLVLDDEAMIEGVIVTIGNRELGLMLLDVVVVGIITT